LRLSGVHAPRLLHPFDINSVGLELSPNNPRSIEDITVVTFHFGSTFWVRHLTERLQQFPDPRITSIMVVDQSRHDADELSRLPGVHRVTSYPLDDEEVARFGHDHPSSIHRVMDESFDTSHILLLDSDCFPVRPSWSHDLAPIHVAGELNAGGLSHPCFNLLPVDIFRQMDYRLGMDGAGFDTGRLVRFQLHQMGLPTQTAKPRRGAFGGRRGAFYLDRGLYHHGSASFIASREQILTKQVNPLEEEALRRCVAEGRFELGFSERLMLQVRSRFGKRVSAEVRSGGQ
jgi:hypothetical protein